MPLPKKHATLDVVKKMKKVKDDDNVLEQKTYIPMVLTTEMKLDKQKKNNMKMNQVFVTDRNEKLGSIVKPPPLKKQGLEAHQYKDKKIIRPDINEYRK
jgi:hypothetical protein